MGLLDDAIREHLDLKRRHGATDEEIAQKEAEALGPARRDFPRPADPEAEDDATEVAAEPDVEQGEQVADEPVEEPLEEPVEEVAEPPLVEAERDAPPASLDTEEYHFEDALPPEREEEPILEEPDEDEPTGDSEDPLEDTPEFLQETPEHDRLWFEQKPPRDFDFD
jgi:hypothetical protein